VDVIPVKVGEEDVQVGSFALRLGSERGAKRPNTGASIDDQHFA
jgi:hypothetical protein